MWKRAALVALPVGLASATQESGQESAQESAQEPPADLTEQIDDFVDAYAERNGLPGGSVAVVKDGTTVYERGFGHDSGGEAVGENTRLRTESLSKSVTAFAVLQLVDEGVIDLDDTVRTYLEAPEPEQMFGGAGGVVSTAHDWALWLGMQQRGGVAADGTRLLAASLVELSHEGQPGAAKSGLGWHLSGADVEPARVGHSGAGGASQQQQDLVPGSGYAVVVLLNSFTV